MKAAVLTGPEKLEIQTLDTPEIKPGEVLVKLKSCGICTLEQRLYRGDMKIYYPIIPGHEAAGEVIEVGSEVLSDLKAGTRVAIDMVTRCGECYYCRTGQSNMCQNRFNKGVRILGGFGEFIAVKSTQVFPIADSVSFKEAAFAEPVACCIRSLKKVGLTIAEDVLIHGAGPMGLMHLQVAKAMGSRVFISDPDVVRLEMAGKMGAAGTFDPTKQNLPEIIKEITEGRGADVCIITSPAHAALKGAVDSLSKVGRLSIYTSYGDKPDLPVDANTLHRNEFLITGSEGRTATDFHQAVRLLGFGMVDVNPLVSSTTGFSGLEEGIKSAMLNSTYRVLLEHEEN